MEKNYMMLPLGLLKQSPARKKIDISVVEDMRQRIIDGLKKDQIEVSELSVIIGPTVVRFEYCPNERYKIKQIWSCENSLDEILSEYGSIRLIAPVPEKGAITVEVPRPDRQIVPLREVLESDEFQRSKAELPIALGISSENKSIVTDLAKMPHLLITGMTGQGKSVLLNNIILSLLYRKSPDDLKLALIDTKMGGFNQYNQVARQYFVDFQGIGQNVITDLDEALSVLSAIAFEMDERYTLFSSVQCRNFWEYNRLIQEGKLSKYDGHQHLPYIIVCINDFADLIEVIGKDAEIIIARIAQKGGAVGIHIIIATRSQSANIVTGIIKVNFPEKIALRIRQISGSRTILDQTGAERLIGHGDLLYSGHHSPLTRIQCCVVDTSEIENVCYWIKTNYEQSQPYQLPIPEFKSIESDKDPLFMDIAHSLLDQSQYKFPYENYRIIGDTAEINKVIRIFGFININIADITSTLSTDTLNYVTVGVGDNITDALEQSVDNLSITQGQVGKMLFQILIPKDFEANMSAIKPLLDFISKYNNDIDVCWGIACDESLTDKIKVILIASSK
ncbi:DNA translocase FtsK [uncultured Duncaniella sp.]|uniref:DNA translocase FtsK n=2 Tax=uncultured Duncaniella sp. TaxID=2768039 RepID=UPI002604C989|nr:DNA translocase FtsK [uncultured Duncaniella sp.]